MAYLGNSPGVASQRVESAFTATSSQTVFTPSSGYTLGYCDVYQNGVKLVNGDDYTAANGTTITLTTGAATGDSIVIVASFPRGLSDGYLKSEADAKFLALTGDQAVAGVKTFSNNVGIGTSSPSQKLSVHGTSSPTIKVRNDTATTSVYSQLLFEGANSFSGTSTSYIQSITLNGGNSSTALAFGTNADGGGAAAERMRIDSSGNLGIGTNAPEQKLDIRNTAGRVSVRLSSGATNQGFISYFNDTQQLSFGMGLPTGTGTNGGQQVNIDSSGNLLVGTTSAISGTQMLQVVNAGGDSTQIRVRCSGAASGRHWRYGTDSGNTLYVINQDSTGVYMSNGNTGWTGLSDERYKDIIEPITGAVEKVASLRAVIGKFKTDEEGKRRAFLIAQDVQAVLPEAVDATNPERLGVTQTDVIPLLVAAIKEQQAMLVSLKAIVDTQAAKIAALEGAK